MKLMLWYVGSVSRRGLVWLKDEVRGDEFTSVLGMVDVRVRRFFFGRA